MLLFSFPAIRDAVLHVRLFLSILSDLITNCSINHIEYKRTVRFGKSSFILAGHNSRLDENLVLQDIGPEINSEKKTV